MPNIGLQDQKLIKSFVGTCDFKLETQIFLPEGLLNAVFSISCLSRCQKCFAFYYFGQFQSGVLHYFLKY